MIAACVGLWLIVAIAVNSVGHLALAVVLFGLVVVYGDLLCLLICFRLLFWFVALGLI